MASPGWRRSSGSLLQALLVLGACLFAWRSSAQGFVGLRSRSGALIGQGPGSDRQLRVARAGVEEVNAAVSASKAATVAAVKSVPMTAAPGDFFGNAVFVFIIPLFLGAAIVYLLVLFRPEAVLTDDQLIKYKKEEKQYFLEKRGARRDPDAPVEQNRKARRAAKSLKGKRRVKS
mmetsp:Transcript_9638/g.17889  ORF Transcript_9638/g.17889 Transcript_9638/m.17889 type:complete len:175 (-) Transcript_9638:174-698(-)